MSASSVATNSPLGDDCDMSNVSAYAQDLEYNIVILSMCTPVPLLPYTANFIS